MAGTKVGGEGARGEEGPEMPFPRVARFLAKLTLRHPWLLAVALCSSVGVALTGVLSIALVIPFLDSMGGESLALPPDFPLAFITPLFEGMDTAERIRTIAGLLVGIAVLRGGLVYIESRLSAYLRILVERDLRQLVFDDLLRVELSYIHKERTAQLHTLLHRYPKQAADIVDQYLSALTKGMTTLTYVLALFAVSVPLTLVALGLGLTSLLAVQRMNTAVKRIARRTNLLRVNLQQTSLEALNGMRLIRLFAREPQARERFLNDVKAVQRQSFRGASVAAAIPPVQSFVNTLLFAALILSATYLLPAENGASWVLMLSLFLIIMTRLIAPLQAFSKRRAKITSEMPALEEIIRFLGDPKPYLREGTRHFIRLEERVRFEDVTFAYDPSDGPIIDRATFDIPRGKTVAIVGASGSGKSTLVHLLARMADPQRGRITVDGVDLRSLDSRAWRRRLAFVSQENFLFNDTVRNNIRFTRPDASEAEVERAARLAHAHDFILQLEDGYDTLVGERGVRLSGGQIQRIAIARAVLADPEILVLDEATSALDTATERDVQEAIEAVARERTVVAIAHRLSTILRADMILVLEKGRIVESGKHEELMAARGHYWRYVQLQDMKPQETDATVRVPVEEPRSTAAPSRPPAEALPPQPVRIVVTHASRRATVVHDDGTRREVPLSIASEDTAAASPTHGEGDHVSLVLGESSATVRCGNVLHHDVPLYVLAESGREVRARVRDVRVPKAGNGLVGALTRGR